MSKTKHYSTIYKHVQNIENSEIKGKLMYYLKNHPDYLILVDYKVESPKHAINLITDDFSRIKETPEYWFRILDTVGNPEPVRKYNLEPQEQYANCKN